MELDQALVEFLYKWNRTDSPLGFQIVDLDVIQEADKYPGQFSNAAETLKTARDLLDETDDSSDPYIVNKLSACEAFLTSLVEAPLAWSQYVHRTLGTTPQRIPHDEVVAQHERCKELLESLGHEFSLDGVHEWDAANRLTPDSVVEAFADAQTRLLPSIKKAAGIDFEVDYITEVVDEDAYWMNWTKTNEHGQVLIRFNVHPRHEWVAGAPSFLAMHEVGGHAIQAMAWKRQIEEGQLPKSAGLFAVFTPDMFLLEGLADTLAYFCADLPLTTTEQWMVERQRMREIALNNAYLTIDEGGSDADALAYMHQWAPGTTTDTNINDSFKNIRGHILLRGYLYSYAGGGYVHRQLAARLDEDGRRRYLQRVYCGPMSATDIMEYK